MSRQPKFDDYANAPPRERDKFHVDFLGCYFFNKRWPSVTLRFLKRLKARQSPAVSPQWIVEWPDSRRGHIPEDSALALYRPILEMAA